MREKFVVDKNNRLVYWPKNSRKTVFAGKWRFDADYNLVFLSKEDEFVFRGEIISATRDSLDFEVKSYDAEGRLHLKIISLKGNWQADPYNRITFLVKKKISPDVLTLQGGWELNKNQQITYSYEQTELKRKTKVRRTVVFEGFWQITRKNKLTYILSHSTDSRFEFRVQVENPNLSPEKGVIKYRLGIGIKQGRPYEKKVISLYGRWSFSRKLGLLFSMEMAKGLARSMEFGVELGLGDKSRVILGLTNKEKEPLGINLIFSRRFLKKLDAELFLKLKGQKGETAVEAGIYVPF